MVLLPFGFSICLLDTCIASPSTEPTQSLKCPSDTSALFIGSESTSALYRVDPKSQLIFFDVHL